MNSNKQEITPSKNGLRWFEEATKSRYLSPNFDIHQIAELANIINCVGLTKKATKIIKALLQKQCTDILSELLTKLCPDKIYRHSNPHTIIHRMNEILKTFKQSTPSIEKIKSRYGGSLSLRCERLHIDRRKNFQEIGRDWKNLMSEIEQKIQPTSPKQKCSRR